MRAHVVENGVIVNTIKVEALGPNMIDGSIGGIGDLWDGTTLTKGERKAAEVVDTWRVKLALAKSGQYAAVAAAVTDPVDLVRWNDKPTIRRGDALSDLIKATLGLTNKQLEALFFPVSE